MTEREADNIIWRSFYLGLRVMAAQLGKEVTFSEMGNLARVVLEIAERETTLHDPTDLAVKFPDMAEMFQRLGALNIRNDREVAERIVQGFQIATEVKDS